MTQGIIWIGGALALVVTIILAARSIRNRAKESVQNEYEAKINEAAKEGLDEMLEADNENRETVEAARRLASRYSGPLRLVRGSNKVPEVDSPDSETGTAGRVGSDSGGD